MKIVILCEWLASSSAKWNPHVTEISYIIFWKNADRGFTVKKKRSNQSNNQEYDFELSDDVERLLEVLNANWDHNCFSKMSILNKELTGEI